MLCSEAESTSLRDVIDVGLMNEVVVIGLRSYLLEVEGIRRANVRKGIFLRALEKYHRYQDRCREMRERLRNDPRSRALIEELARRELQMQQILDRIYALEEQLCQKDEEIEAERMATAERERQN